MCGITGFVDFNQKSDSAILRVMTDALEHRGPDSSGYEFFSNQLSQVGLGHRRLSILDLSENGNQPMFSSCKNYAIILNGEIYNYRDLKNELKKYGFSFSSGTDTEVILNSYIKWGTDCVSKFIGMFAFSIYDRKKERLLIFRDRAGVKPLYYYWRNNLFLFASELKCFHKNPYFEKKVDYDSFALFMQYGYIPFPYSIFKHTYKVRPGYFIEINLKNQCIDEHKYWDVIDCYNKPKLKIDEPELIEEIERVLISSFNYRMVSDVPVGVFLSGGYDSSTVTALIAAHSAHSLKTFTIGFEEDGFNEAPHAKIVSDILGTDHYEYMCTAKEAINIIPQLPFYYDEPFGDSSAIPTILLSRFAKKKVKVALSADGGDEIFAGYSKYGHTLNAYNKMEYLPYFIRLIISKSIGLSSRLGIESLLNKESFDRRLHKVHDMLLSKDIISAMKNTSKQLTDRDLDLLLKSHYNKQGFSYNDYKLLNPSNDSINKMLAIDYKTYLIDDILVKIDRASMSVGLEGRDPFIDHRIIELLARVDGNVKYKGNNLKYLLKGITHKYIPEKIMKRPKAGFEIPISNWLKNELKDLLLSSINEKTLSNNNFFNKKEVISLRDSYLQGRNVKIEKLWFILMFQLWEKQWL
jgi:asparagine synthase (glutamine-hydrolysing)